MSAAGSCTSATTTAATTGPRAGSRPSASSTSTPAARARLHEIEADAAGHPGGDPVPGAAGRDARGLADRLTNERPTPARLSLFGAVEFCLWDANDDATNFQRNLSTGEVEVEDGVVYHVTEYRERRDHFAFFACSRAAGRVRHGARGVPGPVPRLGPAARGRARRDVAAPIAHGWQPIGALQVAVELAPGESREVDVRPRLRGEPAGPQVRPAGPRLGHDADRARHRAPRCEPGAVDADLAALRATWDGAARRRSRSRTGNEHVDRMVNTWNPYQCMVTFNLSRSASMFESGHRPRDGLPRLEPGPARVRPHAPRPGPGTDPRHRRDPAPRRRRLPPVPAAHEARQRRRRLGVQRRPGCGWSLAVAAYVKETGDLAILDEPVPWDNEPGSRDAAARPPPRVASTSRSTGSGRTGCR